MKGITTLTLGGSLRAVREWVGERPEYTASVLGISPRALAQLERDERLPTPELLDLVTELYGFDPLLLVALGRMASPSPRRATESLTAHRSLVFRTLGLPLD